MSNLNSPKRSKINYTALVIASVGLAAAMDFIPAESEEHLTEIIMIVGPSLIFTFRTWFTG